jgi:hypothetical protein
MVDKMYIPTCCVCHKVSGDEDKAIWETSDPENYEIAAKDRLAPWINLTHTYCPPCLEETRSEIQESKARYRENNPSQ